MPERDEQRRLVELIAEFDVVDAASWESFPASDAPNWATGQRYDEAFAEPASESEATLVEIPEGQPRDGPRTPQERPRAE
ncbi:MAG: hypothetical protein IT338_01040 [Thermomicrobiales bacterium]|nr:hypothetical protein [Thermomicrobiales bacterium]